MRVLFWGQVPKDVDYPGEAEDAIEIAVDSARFAISDGASESFDSQTWAQLLVAKFVQSPEMSPEWLSEVARKYNTRFDLSTLSWSKRAAFERGSFATLLGVEEFIDHSSVDILSVGDSLAVLLAGTDMIDSFPYDDPKQFQQRPELLCTSIFHNEFISSPDFFSHHHRTWNLKQLVKPTLLCMTDALGEWALKMAQEGMPQWTTLLSIKEAPHLESLVLNERERRRIRIDDVTLVSVSLGG